MLELRHLAEIRALMPPPVPCRAGWKIERWYLSPIVEVGIGQRLACKVDGFELTEGTKEGDSERIDVG